MIDGRSVLIIIIVVGILMLVYDIGRRNLVVDIDSFGCEKVITKYHGISK